MALYFGLLEWQYGLENKLTHRVLVRASQHQLAYEQNTR